MQRLVQELKSRLQKAKKIVILGVGSALRGDDVAGILVAEDLIKSCRCKKIKVLLGHTAPENLTGQIRHFKPEYLVMVDSAEMGKRPGTAALLDLKKLSGVSFSTHQLPLNILADYIIKDIGCKILVVGIQPARLEFASLPTKEVKKAAKDVSIAIKEAIKQ
jgi:hydrogenase 3 maturation protease